MATPGIAPSTVATATAITAARRKGDLVMSSVPFWRDFRIDTHCNEGGTLFHRRKEHSNGTGETEDSRRGGGSLLALHSWRNRPSRVFRKGLEVRRRRPERRRDCREVDAELRSGPAGPQGRRAD